MRESGRCKKSCDEGYTTNGDRPNKNCVKCHESCATCKDQGKIGDMKKCTKCMASLDFTERKKGSELCFKKPAKIPKLVDKLIVPLLTEQAPIRNTEFTQGGN